MIKYKLDCKHLCTFVHKKHSNIQKGSKGSGKAEIKGCHICCVFLGSCLVSLKRENQDIFFKLVEIFMHGIFLKYIIHKIRHEVLNYSDLLSLKEYTNSKQNRFLQTLTGKRCCFDFLLETSGKKIY